MLFVSIRNSCLGTDDTSASAEKRKDEKESGDCSSAFERENEMLLTKNEIVKRCAKNRKNASGK